MATEKLIIELDAKTKELDASLKSTQKKLDELDGSTKKADTSLATFKENSKKAAIAVTAVAAALGVAIDQAAQYAKELKVASVRSGETVERLQAMAFATNTVGVSLEKLGDIGKDTNEKVGEFIATGGGGFQDFADVVGLSAVEARAAALEFERLSGPEVLQEMVTRMEDAGVSTERMSFALEGMASDTTDLIPLLKDGGKQLKGLTGEFDELGIAISAADLDKITQVGIELDKAVSVFSAESKQLIADYSEELIAGIDAVLLFAQKSTEVFNVVTVGLGNLLAISQAGFTDFINGTDTLDAVIAERAEMSQKAIDRLIGNAPKENGEEAGKLLAEGINEGVEAILDPKSQAILDKELEARDARLEAIRESLKSEEQLLAESLLSQKEFLDLAVTDEEERNELLLGLAQQFNDDIGAIETERTDKKLADLKAIQDAEDKRLKIAKKQAKEEAKTAKDKEIEKLNNQQNAVQLGMALNSLFFEDNKAIAAGLIVADTATGIQKSLAINPYDYVNVGIIAATGVANLANALGASKGGGSVSGASSGGSSTPPQQQREEPETSDLSLSSRGSESTDIVIRFATDTGDELLDALAGGLNERQRRGG